MLFGYSGTIFERLKISFHRLRWRKTRLSCTTGFGRCDYLDFLLKRPQGTTKILGTSAFAGTKAPTAPKCPAKGATIACAENPCKLPALRAEVTRQSVGSDASHLSCSFFGALEACSNSPKTGSKSLSGTGMLPSPKESHTGAHKGKQVGFLCGVLVGCDTTSRRKRMGAFTACIRFLRRRGPAGLRNLFFDYSVVILRYCWSGQQ